MEGLGGEALHCIWRVINAFQNNPRINPITVGPSTE